MHDSRSKGTGRLGTNGNLLARNLNTRSTNDLNAQYASSPNEAGTDFRNKKQSIQVPKLKSNLFGQKNAT